MFLNTQKKNITCFVLFNTTLLIFTGSQVIDFTSEFGTKTGSDHGRKPARFTVSTGSDHGSFPPQITVRPARFTVLPPQITVNTGSLHGTHNFNLFELNGIERTALQSHFASRNSLLASRLTCQSFGKHACLLTCKHDSWKTGLSGCFQVSEQS